MDTEQVLDETVNVRYSAVSDLLSSNRNLKFHQPKFDFNTSKPEKNVVEMVESKEVVKHMNICPLNLQQPLAFNGSWHLVDAQIKLYNTETKLNSVRKKMDKMRKELQNQWNDLEQKELELKKNFIEFNQFVRENNEKRIRATEKIAENKRLTRERQKEIEEFLKNIAEMTEVRNRMDSYIRQYQIYTDYLMQVVNSGLIPVQSIGEILNRHFALTEAKRLLLENQERNMEFLKHAKNNLTKLIEEKNFVIMGLNNQIANLQARYENANIKALESEELVTQIKNNAVKQLEEIDIVKNSVWNLYVHMATSKKHPIKIKKDNVEEQMMYINRTLTELSKVNKLIKKKSTKVK